MADRLLVQLGAPQGEGLTERSWLRARLLNHPPGEGVHGSIVRVPSPMVFTEDIASRLVPLDALKAVERALAEERARFEHRDEGTVTARLGSRLTFRLWEVFGPGRLQLPAVVEARAEASASGSVVRLRLTSDEGGGYLFRAPWAEAAYLERFDQIILRVGRKVSGLPT